MATEFMQPPNMSQFTSDHLSSSSNVSLYTSEAHNRLATGDFGYPSVRKHRSLNDANDKPLHETVTVETKKPKQIREFKVSRRSTLKGPKYGRYSKGYVVPVSKANKRLSKFQKPDQIDPIIIPPVNVLENPNYVISYFTKTLELVKQEPKIFHEILRAELEKENQVLEPLQKAKSRKYQSLPVMKSQNPLVTEKMDLRNQRKSAPAAIQIKYRPTNLTLSDYINTPLSFYQHGRHDSGDSSVVDSKGTTIGPQTKSSKTESAGNSVSTSLLNRSRLTDEKTNSRMLKTKRKDSIIRKQNMYRERGLEDDNLGLQQKISNIRSEKYLSKYGTPLLEAKPVVVEHDAALLARKRQSECGDISIATGNELYDDIKTQLFNKKPKNWKHALKYLYKYHPDLVENDYFMTRLMFELYLRRILAANIALKLGSDKLNRNSRNAAWVGLKESIASVYGEDNALFFESQVNTNE